ncbi:MAG: NIPSNAP family protein [Verrucomicrobiales bacterium]
MTRSKPIKPLVIVLAVAGLAPLACADKNSSLSAPEKAQWQQSYSAGFTDDNGAWAGGSEIMHLAAHKGKLFASNGYWVDARWEIPPDGQKQSAQVLRLDAADEHWQVDLEMGHANNLGLQYMKGNILKSITFTRDMSGAPLPKPQNLLVMAAGANFERGGAVSAWTRNDSNGTWIHTLVRHGSSAGGVRWVPRDMEIHRDKVTGVEHLVMSLGNPGIISGVYDPSVPGRIRWNRNLEYPFLSAGSFKTRPLGMTQANGSLFFSEGDSIYRRIDGKQPAYTEILDLYADTDTDVGGIRGLTSISNPTGPGESLLFLWAPGERSRGQIKRLDPDGNGGYRIHDEAQIADLMGKALDVEIAYTLGAHNMMYPLTDPATGKTVHLIGFQGNIRGKTHLRWKGSALYAGAMYAIRHADRSYSVHEINNAYRPGKQVLVSPRTFCLSPFGDGDLYIGGHDSSRKVSDNMAWIFKAPLQVALGTEPGADGAAPPAPLPPHRRLLEGPVYELRIYAANEHRFAHLIKRFGEHTDRIFRKHALEPMGYWIPTEGPPKKRRRFIYILKHASRYAAYRNWNQFSNDREWQAVLDQPEFQGLLAEKPTSIFMTANDYSAIARDDIKEPGGTYELRTYIVNPGKLPSLNARFAGHTTRLFKKHGINNVAYWTPFEKPDSENTLIYLIHHAGRKQVDANWKAFGSDPQWQKVARESQLNGMFLAAPPERIYLKAMEFSPLK